MNYKINFLFFFLIFNGNTFAQHNVDVVPSKPTTMVKIAPKPEPQKLKPKSVKMHENEKESKTDIYSRYFIKANEAFENKDYNTAIDYYSKCYSANYNKRITAYNLGVSYTRINYRIWHPEIIKYFKLFVDNYDISIDKTLLYNAREELAWAYCFRFNNSTQDWEQALDYINKCLETKDDINLIDTRGVIFYKMKDYESSLKDFYKIVNSDSSKDFSYYFAGLSAKELGYKGSALAFMMKAKKLYKAENEDNKLYNANMIENEISEIKKQIDDEVYKNMVFVEGSEFVMGEKGCCDGSHPNHKVNVNNFYIAKYELSSAQYQEYLNFDLKNQRSHYSYEGISYPAEMISWDNAIKYCEWLSSVTGKNYRLPTEAEWEFAASGGTKSQHYYYCGSNDPNTISWFKDNSEDNIHPIGQKKPNELGLYDMSGNSWEWCSDYYDPHYYSVSPINNPKGPNLEQLSDRNNPTHVLRGGSFTNVVTKLSYSARAFDKALSVYTNYGFRIVLTN